MYNLFIETFERTGTTMVKLNVQQLLDERGKTRYWLVQQMQTSYKTVNRLCDDESVAVQLETVGKLCAIFECTPNDIFILEEPREKELP